MKHSIREYVFTTRCHILYLKRRIKASPCHDSLQVAIKMKGLLSSLLVLLLCGANFPELISATGGLVALGEEGQESTETSNNDIEEVKHDPELATRIGMGESDAQACLANNCYNHATKPTNTFAQPGRGGGLESIDEIELNDVVERAKKDGLVSVTKKEALTTSDNNYAALVVGNRDFHWYRKETDGLWTHKPGVDPVTDEDANGASIFDPSKAAWGPNYNEFGGFFRVPKTATIAKRSLRPFWTPSSKAKKFKQL
jgi:hypothetical protein